MAKKRYYLLERHNPQFKKPYYSKQGLLSKTAAKKMEKPLYAENVMLEFDTEQEYEEKIKEVFKNGFNVF